MSPVGVERNKNDKIELTITIQKDASGYGMKVVYFSHIFFLSFIILIVICLFRFFLLNIFCLYISLHWFCFFLCVEQHKECKKTTINYDVQQFLLFFFFRWSLELNAITKCLRTQHVYVCCNCKLIEYLHNQSSEYQKYKEKKNIKRHRVRLHLFLSFNHKRVM